MTPLPPDYTIGDAQRELDSRGHITTDFVTTLHSLSEHVGFDGANDQHAICTLDWAYQIAFLEKMNLSDALDAAMTFYFG